MAKQVIPGKRKDTFLVDPLTLVIVGLDTDETDHPLYDERLEEPASKLEPLALSIMQQGMLQPVTVRKDGENGDSRVVVVIGRRRVRAARIANERLLENGEEPRPIQAMHRSAKELSDPDALMAMVAENELRRNDSWMTKASKARRLLDVLNGDFKKTAVAFGVTVPAVRDWLKVLKLSPEVQQMIRDGRIAPSAAIKLAKLPHNQQEAALAAIEAESAKPTVTNVAAVAEQVESSNSASGEGGDSGNSEGSENSGSNDGTNSPSGGSDGNDPMGPLQPPVKLKRQTVKTLRGVLQVAEEAMTGDDTPRQLEGQALWLLKWIMGDDKAADKVGGLDEILAHLGQ